MTMVAATSRSSAPAPALLPGTRRPQRESNDTVLTQSTMPMRTALRKPFSGHDLRRAGSSERRGQDANTPRFPRENQRFRNRAVQNPVQLVHEPPPLTPTCRR
jgi:hypothetical protein